MSSKHNNNNNRKTNNKNCILLNPLAYSIKEIYPNSTGLSLSFICFSYSPRFTERVTQIAHMAMSGIPNKVQRGIRVCCNMTSLLLM